MILFKKILPRNSNRVQTRGIRKWAYSDSKRRTSKVYAHIF